MDVEYNTRMFFDLQKSITTDVKFIDKISRIQQEMQKAAEANDDDTFRHYQVLLLRACDYNPSLLVPYFFPKYPNDKPMTFWSRPHAFSMMAFIPNGTLTIQASRQIGKCVSGQTEMTIMDTKTKNKNIQTIEDLFNEARQKHVSGDDKAMDD